MTSASMVSHSIKESSHHSNSNRYNPMSMRKHIEKDCKLCPSDLKQSGDPWDKTLARMNTSGRSQTPSHSMNERLWNDVNLLDNISDWNETISD